MKRSVEVRGLVSFTVLSVLAVATLGGAGCTAASRGIGQLTANKYATPESGLTWNVPAPDLEPVEASRRTVYLSVRDITGAQGLDVRAVEQSLRAGITANGYELVHDPTKATYRLNVRLRYFGENEKVDGGAAMADALGVIGGAATGAGTAAAIHALSGNTAGAIAGGGLVGGLVGVGLANASRVREWVLIADVLLEEKLDREIEIEVYSGAERGSDTSAEYQTGRDSVERQQVMAGSTRRSGARPR